MAKIIFYKFYSMEDWVNALEFIEDDIAEYLEGKPGFNVEYTPQIDEKNYLIQLLITNDIEDGGFY